MAKYVAKIRKPQESNHRNIKVIIENFITKIGELAYVKNLRICGNNSRNVKLSVITFIWLLGWLVKE